MVSFVPSSHYLLMFVFITLFLSSSFTHSYAQENLSENLSENPSEDTNNAQNDSNLAKSNNDAPKKILRRPRSDTPPIKPTIIQPKLQPKLKPKSPTYSSPAPSPVNVTPTAPKISPPPPKKATHTPKTPNKTPNKKNKVTQASLPKSTPPALQRKNKRLLQAKQGRMLDRLPHFEANYMSGYQDMIKQQKNKFPHQEAVDESTENTKGTDSDSDLIQDSTVKKEKKETKLLDEMLPSRRTLVNFTILIALLLGLLFYRMRSQSSRH